MILGNHQEKLRKAKGEKKQIAKGGRRIAKNEKLRRAD
jgi:hypothetical protein